MTNPKAVAPSCSPAKSLDMSMFSRTWTASIRQYFKYLDRKIDYLNTMCGRDYTPLLKVTGGI